MIVAVDFDGTLCANAWPEIGVPRNGVIDYVKQQKENGAKLILWTNRAGERLDAAIAWCAEQGIAFDAINKNLPEIIEAFGGDTRKVFANEYLDDRAITPESVEKQSTVPAIPVEWLKEKRKYANEGDNLDVGIAEVLDMWKKEQEVQNVGTQATHD